MTQPGNLYRHIFLSLTDGVLLLSRDMTILRGNLAVEEMFLASRDTFEGKSLETFFPEQPLLFAKIREVFDTGTTYCDIECRGLRKFAAFPAVLTLSPMLDPEGGTEHVVLLAKDVSLLKELQETARQMERSSGLDVLALGMAHEIKNPLVAIGGSAQLLLRDLESPEQKKYLEVVISEVNRINRMVERMLDFARPGQLDLKPVNIHKALEEILALEKVRLAQKKGRFVQCYDPSLPLVEADEDKLKQVFLNLIQNAVDAVPEGGEIKLITRVGQAYAVKTAAQTSSRLSLIVEIADSGPGIAPDKMQHLFTPFYTTKKKGNGLGLPISLKIVEEHQGKIKIVSEPGKGATAQIILPQKQS
jgi:two-component system nitrogen regulation sensor histidine kinase GlnL